MFTETVTLAFKDDPTWSPVVESNADDPDAARRYWEFFVRSSQRFPWMGQSDDGAAVSVWLPPGADELTPEEEDRFPDFAAELFGASRRDELLGIIERFDAARPEGDYFYLSLLPPPCVPSHLFSLFPCRESARRLAKLCARDVAYVVFNSLLGLQWGISCGVSLSSLHTGKIEGRWIGASAAGSASQSPWLR